MSSSEPDWNPEATQAEARALEEDPPLMEDGKVAKIPFAKNKVIIFSDALATVGLSAEDTICKYSRTEVKTGLSVVCLCSSQHRLWDPLRSPVTYLRVMHRSARFTKLRSPYPWCEYLLLSRREVDPDLLHALDNSGPFRYGDTPTDLEMTAKYGQTRLTSTQHKLVHFNTNSTLNLACRYIFEWETAHFSGAYPRERMFLHTGDIGMEDVIDERTDQALGYARVGESVAGLRLRFAHH